MFGNNFNNILICIWISIIIMCLFIMVKEFKLFKKLGKSLSKNKMKFNIYIINTIVFSLLVYQKIDSYQRYEEIYSLIAAIGISLSVLNIAIRGFSRQGIHENGILTYDGIVFWEDIFGYMINESENNSLDLCFVASHKQLFKNYKMKDYDFNMNKSDFETINKTILENKVKQLK